MPRPDAIPFDAAFFVENGLPLRRTLNVNLGVLRARFATAPTLKEDRGGVVGDCHPSVEIVMLL